jgi:hypothetical protein
LYDGKGVNWCKESEVRRKKIMSKKVQTIVGIVWVLLVLCGYWYYREQERAKPDVARATEFPVRGEPVPAPGVVKRRRAGKRQEQ